MNPIALSAAVAAAVGRGRRAPEPQSLSGAGRWRTDRGREFRSPPIERAGEGIEIGDLVFRARRPFCLSCITVNQSELKREGTRNSFVSSFVSFLGDGEGLCEEGVCKGTGHEMGPHVGVRRCRKMCRF